MESENIENIFSKDALICIMNNGMVQDPVLQVLTIKKMSMPGKPDRFVLYLSDTENFCAYVVLQTKLNHLVYNQLTQFSVVQLKHYATSFITDTETNITKKVLVIFDLVVLVHGDNVGYQVGTPSEVPDFHLGAEVCNPITTAEAYEIQELLKDLEIMK